MSTHVTKVVAKWNGSFNGRGHIDSVGFKTNVSLPKEFGGLGEGASPEDLLLSSIASCYLITLGIILDKAGVLYQSLAIDGQLMTKTGPPASIEEVVLTVQITTETSKATIEQLAARVDGFCLIAKVIKDGIKKTVHLIQQNPVPTNNREFAIGGG